MNIKTEIVDAGRKDGNLYWTELTKGECFQIKSVSYVRDVFMVCETMGLEPTKSIVRLASGTSKTIHKDMPIIQVYPKNTFQFTLAKPEEA